MRRLLYIAIGAAVLGGVYWERFAEYNEGRAYYSPKGPVYLVEIKRWEFPLVHDPVSFLLGRTYQATTTLQLPSARYRRNRSIR